MNNGDVIESERFREAASMLSSDPAKAFASASGASDDPACRYLAGLLLVTGTGTAADKEKGLAELDAASEAEILPAGIVADEVRAAAEGINDILSLRIRAEGGDLEACKTLFALYDTGKNPDGTRAIIRKDHAEAVRLYMPCADAGDHEAQETIGYMFLMGKGVPKNRELAVSLLEKAAEGGVARAAYRIAYMHDAGQCFADQDLEKAVVWYRKAAEMGYAEASFQLAGISFMKDTKWYDAAAGRKYIEAAAEAGFPEAEFQLGRMYVYGGNGFKKDVNKGRMYLVRACEHDVQDAQVEYANLSFEGTVIPRDMAEAARWFTAAAKGFSGTAMYALGCMYANGYHFDVDDEKAAGYFTEAAEGGEVNAQYALACFCYEGRGIPKDVKKAAVWFREAADQGHPGAMSFLGMFMITGKEMEQDIEGGLELLKTAASHGYYEAQFYLGKLYVEGEYVKKDISYAKKMLQLAAKQGDPDAQVLLDEIKKKRLK